MTAYESKPSRLVQMLSASPLAVDYHIGSLKDHGTDDVVTAHGLVLRGLPGVARLEAEAAGFARRALNAREVDFRPLSGVHAILATLIALTEPGDLVLSISPEHGGHFATRYLLRRIGRRSAYLPWDAEAYAVDVERLAARLSARPAPAAVLFDHGLPLTRQPVERIREVVGERALVLYDASHTLGLVVGRRFQDPLGEGADVVQGNTHKSFPGVQKAVIATRSEELGERIGSALSDGLVSSQHTHHAVATYAAFLEMREFGEGYAEAMIANARALAAELEALGARVIGPAGRWTDSHEVFVAPGAGLAAATWAERLIRAGVSVNARRVHGQDALRIGVQSVTRAGMTTAEMASIARVLTWFLHAERPRAHQSSLIRALTGDFSSVYCSFDHSLGLSAA
ncbi:MAG: aminotransferase class I/II-fold pyridoxal phosphate-dependent enzyme [Saccharothrix sp.]|nr:aminotransferase class I/II-fold pyridoxal phosphate-dependent enzyme [Saccharothrix sp.]